MISLQNLVVSEEMKQLLEAICEHPTNGYLFFGIKGAGKRFCIDHVAAILLKCNSLDELRMHPDLIVLTRESGAKEIKVKQTRDLIQRLSLSAARGGRQVVILDEVDRLNEESGNALLKLIEEPPKNVTFFAITHREERVLSTIRSRLVPVAFRTLSRVRIRQELQSRGVESDTAGIIAHHSHGAIGEAIRMIEHIREVTQEHEEALRFVRVMVEDSTGRRISEIEKLAKRITQSEDSEMAWEDELLLLQDAIATISSKHIYNVEAFARGVALAWRCIGTAVSPHLALEWGALSSYRSSKQPLPHTLLPYLT